MIESFVKSNGKAGHKANSDSNLEIKILIYEPVFLLYIFKFYIII